MSVGTPKTDVKDTVGAGDAFIADLIFGLIHGAQSRPALDAACLLGSYVASQNGATPKLPVDVLVGFKKALNA